MEQQERLNMQMSDHRLLTTAGKEVLFFGRPRKQCLELTFQIAANPSRSMWNQKYPQDMRKFYESVHVYAFLHTSSKIVNVGITDTWLRGNP